MHTPHTIKENIRTIKESFYNTKLQPTKKRGIDINAFLL
jgi:macrodomain Ter protein organizer (MatP/YcbG family)